MTKYSVPKGCIEHCLALISLLDPDEVEGISQIKLGEEAVPAKSSEGSIQKRKRVLVLADNLIETLIV